MAIIKAVNSKASIGKGINYITKEEKTEEKLISGINCNSETAIDEMKATKELYDKTNGRQYAHYIQSFNPDDNISPEKAHEIGKEWLERNDKFNGHEVIMATHKDKDHIHNHFIINSVNYENGNKLHTTKHEYHQMKVISNKLSREHGLTVPMKSKEQGKITSFNQNKYQIMKNHFGGKAKSYVIDTAIAVKDTQEKAVSKEDFIEKMEQQGYKTNWKDTSKHVTFINKETGKRVRLANLEKTFNDKDFTKGGLNHEFERNKETARTKRTSRGIDERDKRTKSTNAELHKGSHEREYNEPNSNRPRTGTNNKNQSRSPRKNAFDFDKAREHSERLHRETRATYGKWKNGNDRKQSKDIGTNGSDRENSKNKLGKNERGHEKQLERVRTRDIEFDR